jgi:dipeptidyl aminopeptidase/acylaminoacyl peptidase
MSRILSTVMFVVLSSPCFATELMQDQKNCFRRPFESYQTWLDVLTSKKKNFNKEAFLTRFPKEKFDQRQQDIDCVDFTYQVDGLIVEGYYLKPKVDNAAKLPVVIFNRGGNGAYGYMIFPEKMDYLPDIVMAGYIVIGSQYRGSSNRSISNNGDDEFGGADVNDVLTLLALAKEIPLADTSRTAMIGWSRGVMQSYLAAKKMPELKAIISIAGVADAEKELIWRPAMETVYTARVPDFAENRAAELKKRSVLHWIDDLPRSSPILLIHGAKDERVNVEQSKLLAKALSDKSYPHKLVIYEGDKHGLVQNRDELIKEIQAWLAKYI